MSKYSIKAFFVRVGWTDELILNKESLAFKQQRIGINRNMSYQQRSYSIIRNLCLSVCPYLFVYLYTWIRRVQEREESFVVTNQLELQTSCVPNNIRQKNKYLTNLTIKRKKHFYCTMWVFCVVCGYENKNLKVFCHIKVKI